MPRYAVVKPSLFAVFLFILLFLPFTIKAETQPTQAWIARYDNGGNDNPFAFTTDNNGNSYVTGISCNTASTSCNNYGYTTVKYDTDGNQLWVARYNGGQGSPSAIRVDSLGNVYVTGYNSTNSITVKYSAAGNQLWLITSDFVARALSVDNTENVYVTAVNVGHYYITTKFDKDGNKLWQVRYGDRVAYDAQPDDTVASQLDSAGNLYITGNTFNGNGYDFLTTKYDTNGNQLWLKTYDGGLGDVARAISVDNSRNVYITGISSSGAVIIKYDSNGNQLWAAKYSGDYQPTDISLDSFGDVYITGSTANFTSSIIVKYDSNGNQLWAVKYSASGFTRPKISIDPLGNAYILVSGAIVKYDRTGNQFWAINTSDYSFGTDMTLDTFNNIYVSGYDHRDYVVVKYIQIQTPTILLPGILGSWTGNTLDFFDFFNNPNPIPANKLSFIEESQALPWQGLDALGYLPHTWEELKVKLPQQGYQVYKCPYDWRNGNAYSAENYLMPCIDKAKAETGASKVNIVAHSMGGLVARSYIQNDTLYRNDVDKLAFVGTPNHGSVNAYYLWEGGNLSHGLLGTLGEMVEKTIGGRLMKMGALLARIASVNYVHAFFPSIQELLPTFPYLTIKTTGSLLAIHDMVWRNTLLSDINAQTNIARLAAPVTSKVFAGEGHATTEALEVTYPNPENLVGLGFLPYPDGKPTSGKTTLSLGDLTVLSGKSAEITEAAIPLEIKTKTANDPENFLAHTNLPNSFSNEIVAFLGGSATTTPSFAPRFPDAMLAVSLASPANLLIIGPDGKKLGFDAASQIEQREIQQGIYSGRNDQELATLVDPLPGTYKVYVTGNGPGEFHTGISYAKEGCEGTIEQDNVGITATGTVTVFTLDVAGGCANDAASYTLDATIRLEPRTLNKESEGNYIKAGIRLPAPYDAKDIDITTVTINNTVSAVSGKLDEEDGIPTLKVKFPRADVQKMLALGTNTLSVSGKLKDGTMWKGSATIRVVENKGDKEQKSNNHKKSLFTGLMTFILGSGVLLRVVRFLI